MRKKDWNALMKLAIYIDRLDLVIASFNIRLSLYDNIMKKLDYSFVNSLLMYLNSRHEYGLVCVKRYFLFIYCGQ